MADAKGCEWGLLFAEIVQDLWNRTTEHNETDALSKLMYSETRRLLYNKKALVLQPPSALQT